MEEGFEEINLNGVIPTPTIRANGKWFVGNKDTGVAAKGEKGDQGIQGIQGEKGEKGDQGEKGTDADTSELERLSNEVDTINQSLFSAIILFLSTREKENHKGSLVD